MVAILICMGAIIVIICAGFGCMWIRYTRDIKDLRSRLRIENKSISSIYQGTNSGTFGNDEMEKENSDANSDIEMEPLQIDDSTDTNKYAVPGEIYVE